MHKEQKLLVGAQSIKVVQQGVKYKTGLTELKIFPVSALM